MGKSIALFIMVLGLCAIFYQIGKYSAPVIHINSGIASCPTPQEAQTNVPAKITGKPPLTQPIKKLQVQKGIEFAYVLNANSTTVSQCPINSADGLLEGACATTGKGLNAPTGIEFNASQTMVYIANKGGNTISMCGVNPISGSFDNCVITGGDFVAPSAVILEEQKSVAFVSNQGDSTISRCSRDPIKGTLAACNKLSVDGISSPTDFALDINHNFIYITNEDTNLVIFCSIDGQSNLSNCQPTGGGFNSPQAIMLDKSNKYAYITNNGSHTISLCDINYTNGELGNCRVTGSGFNGLSDLTLNTARTMAYVSNASTLSVCKVDGRSGELFECKTSGSGFNIPSGVRLHIVNPQ